MKQVASKVSLEDLWRFLQISVSILRERKSNSSSSSTVLKVQYQTYVIHLYPLVEVCRVITVSQQNGEKSLPPSKNVVKSS